MGVGVWRVNQKACVLMKKTLFEIACHIDGHAYVISVFDSHGSLDLDKSGLVDVLYDWTQDDGPLRVEDVLEILDAFCSLRDEYEIHCILNEPRISSRRRHR